MGASISKLGTIVRLPDGREGTVVFNGLMGVGVKWGRHDPPESDFDDTDGNTCQSGADGLPHDWPWEPDALLRDPNIKRPGVLDGWDCVCPESDVTVLRYGLYEWQDDEDTKETPR